MVRGAGPDELGDGEGGRVQRSREMVRGAGPEKLEMVRGLVQRSWEMVMAVFI